MKLYSFSPTPNNRKVEAFIKHFDLPVEIHSMGFKEQENKTEAYLKMNPLGKAPVLEDGDFITYTTETARRLMRFDLRNKQQMDDLDNYLDADPNDRTDKRWFIAPAYIPDGRLLCTVADGVRIYDEQGGIIKDIPLPGYGWAQVAPDVDNRYALAANVWTGVAARIDLDKGKITESIDVGFTAPHRSLAGLAVYAGQGS
jgi:hypothetical protein